MRTAVPVVVLVLLAACSSGGDTADTAVAISSTASTVAPTSTTEPSTTSTAAPETTTTVALPDDQVGSKAALLAAIERAIRETEDFYDYDPDEVPIPDLTNPDPTVALREILLFEAWVFANAPKSDWAAVYSYAGSPASTDLLWSLDATFLQPWNFESTPGIDIWNVRLATDAEIATHAAQILESAPDGSSTLVYEYTVSAFQRFDLELQRIVETSEGAPSATNVMVVSPGPNGWQKYFTVRS